MFISWKSRDFCSKITKHPWENEYFLSPRLERVAKNRSKYINLNIIQISQNHIFSWKSFFQHFFAFFSSSGEFTWIFYNISRI